MDKTRKPVSSKIWPDSTCAISVRRKGQILLVAGFLVLSTTDNELQTQDLLCNIDFSIFTIRQLEVFSKIKPCPNPFFKGDKEMVRSGSTKFRATSRGSSTVTQFK